MDISPISPTATTPARPDISPITPIAVTPASPTKVEPSAVETPKDGIKVENKVGDKVEDKVEITDMKHNSENVNTSINMLFGELPEDGAPPPTFKRKRSASVVSLSSETDDDERSEQQHQKQQQKTFQEANYDIHGHNDPRERSKPHPSLVKLQRSMAADQRPRPVVMRPVAQKVSIGAQIATPWDPFKRRELTEDTTKLDLKTTLAKQRPEIASIAPTTRFRSWKDENDEMVTWKVFPKTTPRIKHRGGMVVVKTILQDPAEHPDITIREYEEDKTCWIARVEDLSEEMIAGRRAELARAESAQRGRRDGAAPKKRAKTSYT